MPNWLEKNKLFFLRNKDQTKERTNGLTNVRENIGLWWTTKYSEFPIYYHRGSEQNVKQLL